MRNIKFEDRGSFGMYSAILGGAGGNSPLHYHKTFELKCVMEGYLEITINGVTEKAPAGSFVLVLPNQIHLFNNAAALKLWSCKFSADIVPGFADYIANKQGASAVFSCDTATMAYCRQNLLENERFFWHGEAANECRPFADLPPEEKALRLLTIQGYLHIICSYYASQPELRPRSLAIEKKLLRLTNYVQENFRGDITLESAAQALGYSHNYLSHCFHQSLGINFKHFVNQHRLDYARKLMSEDKMTIGQAALESGFGSVRNFNRVYKNMTGRTPTEKEH